VDVGQQIRVCERHALGLPGAARRVLDEGLQGLPAKSRAVAC
jgi:hypothetical protein